MIFEISRVCAVSALTTTIVCLTCSLLSIINNLKIKVNISFAILSFIVGEWSFLSFLMFILKGTQVSLNMGRIIYIFVIFLPPILYFFIFSIIELSNKNTKLIISILSSISFVFLLFIPSNMFIKGIAFNNNYYSIIPGQIYFAFIVYIILSCIYSVILIIKQYQQTLVVKTKKQLKILILSFFIAFIAIGAHIVVAYDNIIVPHNIFTMLFILLMFYSIYNYENLDIQKLIFFKIAIYIITYFVVVGIPLYIVFMYEKLSLNFIVLFIISTIIYSFMIYIKIEAENFLLTKQNIYQKLLSKISEEIVCKYELQEVCHIIINLIIEMIKVKSIYIFIYDIDKRKYLCLDTNMVKSNNSINFDISDKVVTFIEAKNKSFILSEDEQIFNFTDNDISVVTPIIINGKLIGCLFVGHKQDNTIYSQKDLEVFDAIANQVAVSIQKVWFSKINFKQQEKLVKIEKLAAIGGMTNGLAHQIKNKLNIFSLIGASMKMEFDLLEKSIDNFSSKEEFIQFFNIKCGKIPQAISDNVEQTLNLLQNILNFAKSNENILQFETFSFNKTIQQVEELVRLKHSKYRFLLSLNISKDDNIYAIKTQIQEVLFNFIDNAVEATIAKKEYLKNNNEDLNKYKPEIKISLKSFSDKWQIVIEDNGIGIKQEDKIKIFSVFFTTKTSSLSNPISGSGIGTYIARRMIVDAHKGTIIFESEYGKGTSFIITLPKIYKK